MILYKIYFSIVLWLLILTSVIIRFFAKIFRFFGLNTKRSADSVKILFLENQTSNHAGAHFRVEIVRDKLALDGIKSDVHYPFSSKEFEHFNQSNIDKHLLLSKMLIRKFRAIIKTPKYDLVIVRRELLHHFEYGGVYFEKLLISLNKNIILDMDDYMPYLRKNLLNKKSIFNRLNKSTPTKALDVLKIYPFFTMAMQSFSDDISVRKLSNNYTNIHVFPMCVNYPKKIKAYNSINKIKKVGWISQSIHFNRIDEIVPYLNEVYETTPFELVIVAEKTYTNNQLIVPVSFVKWSIESELEIMLNFDIGIAPIFIKKEEQNRKGTFKLIQYMSVGLVSIVTDLPYTRNQISDGKNGFLIESEKEWVEKLTSALNLENSNLEIIGKNAYDTFYYSHHIDIQYPLLRDFYLNIAKAV